jgi:hypothetical protein
VSVEADFGISEWVFQASGTQLSWSIAWPGVIDDGRYVAVSFQSDFSGSQLVRVSEWFSNGTTVGELIRASEIIDGQSVDGVAFRFSVVVIPSH